MLYIYSSSIVSRVSIKEKRLMGVLLKNEVALVLHILEQIEEVHDESHLVENAPRMFSSPCLLQKFQILSQMAVCTYASEKKLLYNSTYYYSVNGDWQLCNCMNILDVILYTKESWQSSPMCVWVYTCIYIHICICIYVCVYMMGKNERSIYA